MYINKWHTLAASAVLQLIAGVAYTFSLYAPSLKSALHLSQARLEGIGSAILCGGLTAWIPGLLYDNLAGYNKLAPRLTAGIGLASHVVGYTTIWAAASGRIALPYWGLIVAGLVASSGLLWLDTAAIVTSMRNFPIERGSIAGILKTFLGLSASIATTIYSGSFAPHGIDFLLFLAVGPAALGLVVLPLINHVPYVEENEVVHQHKRMTTGWRLFAICGVISLLLVYQMLTALLATHIPGNRFAIMVAALAILAASIIMIPIGTGGLRSQPAGQRNESEPAAPESSPLLAASATAERIQRRSTGSAHEDLIAVEESGQSRKVDKPSTSREWNLHQCLCSVDYWMMWTGLLLGIGSGFTLLNNFGQHVEALRAEEGGQQIYVLLFATFNCLGRMICGFGSELLLHRYAVPRTVVFLGLSLGTAVIYIIVAFADLNVLLACSVFAGLAFGGHWALMPSMTADLFGTKHFAANQSIMYLSTALGALLLSTELTGTLFDKRGKAQGDPPDSCIGPHCFRAAYAIIAGLALVQTGFSTLLFWRSRPLYKKLHLRLQRLEAESYAS